MLARYEKLDKSRPHTGLDYHIIQVFSKCTQAQPPVLGSAQLGIRKYKLLLIHKHAMRAQIFSKQHRKVCMVSYCDH